MKTPKRKVLTNLIGQIPPHIITSRVDIPRWKAVDGIHSDMGRFEVFPDTERILRLGDSWSSGYDKTTWFSAETEIPRELLDKKLWLELDFGGEAIVRINGKIAGGVSSRMNSGWVHRDRIFLPDPLPGDAKLKIELEATVDSGGFFDIAVALGKTETEFRLAKAAIIAVDEAAESYYTDLQIVETALDVVKDPAISARLYAAMDDSLHLLDFDFGSEAFRASVPAAAALLWERIEKIKYIPQGEVIMTGHSHIDVAWLWTVRETLRKCARTFSNAAALLKRYPGIVFTQSQAVLYDMVREHYPEIYAEIRELVAAGSWDITGNAWVEADTNVAGGEALIRQLLYGREFFLREFGKSSEIYWLPDCFGFSYALPQIIKKSGMKYFLTAKLNGQDTNRFPNTVFRWRGADGSEVIAYLQRTSYNGDYGVAQVAATWDSNDQKDVTDTALGMFGYGDGGGGPTYEMAERGRRIAKIPGIPGSKFGRAADFFEKVAENAGDLPVWDDEMYYENHRGTYTSQAFVKKYNRMGEFLLTRAEMAECFLEGTGVSGPSPELFEAWKLLLINQFHDILPGSSIQEVYVNTRAEYEKMDKIGTGLLNASLSGLAAKISSPSPALAVFNLGPAPYSGALSVPAPSGGLLPESLPHALEPDGSLTLLLKDVPALGYALVPLTPGAAPEKTPGGARRTPREAGGFVLENGVIRAEIDENGCLVSLFDLENGREALSAPANILTVYSDKPIHESAWNLEANYVKKSWELDRAEIVRAGEENPVYASVFVEKAFNKSRIRQEIRLVSGSRRLDFVTSVDWHEREKLLRASFPAAVKAPHAAYEIAHGAIYRPTHQNTSYDAAKFEVCAHKWADLSEGGYGVALMSDSKYGYDIHSSVMGISLLKAPIIPDLAGDIGGHEFTYSVYPHAHSWQEGGVVAEAFALNQRPYALEIPEQSGELPGVFAFAECSASNIIVDAVKPAQDGDGVILRVYEAEAKRGDVRMRLAMPFESAFECNMMEENERELPVSDGGFTFFTKPHEVSTFRIK